MATTAKDATPASLLGSLPPWVFILVGLTGGGASGTLLSRPVFGAEEGANQDEIQLIVDRSIEKNNVYLLQQIELILAKDKLSSKE